MILAIDPSSRNTGWCIGYSINDPCITGSESFSGYRENLGQLAKAYSVWLRKLIEKNPFIEMIVYEQPIRPVKSSLLTLRQLYTLGSIIEMVAQDHNIPVFEVNNGSHKKVIYGHGGKKPAEHEAIKRANEWSYRPKNGDEADACGVHLITIRDRYPHNWLKKIAERDFNMCTLKERLI